MIRRPVWFWPVLLAVAGVGVGLMIGMGATSGQDTIPPEACLDAIATAGE